MDKIKVMIVDDAVVVRQILSNLLGEDPDIQVVGTASNGKIALAKLPQLQPDLITLDIEMPEMDGLQTLREIRKNSRLPIIMFSTLTERGAASTLDALSAGASDYVTKPANVGSVAAAITRIKNDLIPKIKSLVSKGKPLPMPVRPTLAKPSALPASMGNAKIEALAIGVSTGGPNALSALLPKLPADFAAPVFIVQHMPPLFTKFLAERLAAQCKLKVFEAQPGQVVAPGNIYLAPGDYHLVVERMGSKVLIGTNQQPPENSCRPAVDVLFRSVAKVYGGKALGLILTGMGSDGLHGCETLRAAGGRVIVQDQATSVVWGMPGYVANAGLAERVLPLDGIAPELIRIINGPVLPARIAG